MRKFSVCLLATAFIFLLVNPASLAREKKSDVFGYFFLTGKVPAAFRDIDHLSLDGDYGLKQKPPTYGRIRLKNRARTDYILLRLTIRDKNLSFKTRAVRGVSYEFEGVLTRTSFDNQPPADEVVLRGTLRKMRGGKAIAEEQVGFTWELGD